MLKRCGGVAEAKRDHIILKQAIPAAKCSLPLLATCYTKEVIRVSQVKACEVLGVPYSIQEFRDKW